jgi:hypothetical protein
MNGRFRTPINGLLVGSAVVMGWWSYGWPGLALALTLIVFWLILQFNRATRVMRNAGQRPVGQVDSVVMTQSRLEPGMTMLDVLPLTGSLGIKRNHRDEWQWSDAAGNDLVLIFRRDVLVRWEVARALDDDDESEPTQASPGSASAAESAR